jgi:hypothetical protein
MTVFYTMHLCFIGVCAALGLLDRTSTGVSRCSSSRRSVVRHISPPYSRNVTRRASARDILSFPSTEHTSLPFIPLILDLAVDSKDPQSRIRQDKTPREGETSMARSMLAVSLLSTLLPVITSALPSLSLVPAVDAGQNAVLSMLTHDIGAGSVPIAYGDPPKQPGPPAAAISEGGGWLSRWLSMGGEGDLNVFVSRSQGRREADQRTATDEIAEQDAESHAPASTCGVSIATLSAVDVAHHGHLAPFHLAQSHGEHRGHIDGRRECKCAPSPSTPHIPDGP